MKILATRPAEYVRFVTTGRLPQGVKPSGPLVDLLRSIQPIDRLAIRNVTIDARFGYTGSRTFPNAQQAFLWVHPEAEVFGAFPAEQCRDKTFSQHLTLLDLLANATSYPSAMVEKVSIRSNIESTQRAASEDGVRRPKP